jgi:transposase
MPAPIPMPVRRLIVQLHERKLSFRAIADKVKHSVRSVIRLIVRSRQEAKEIPATRYSHAPGRVHGLPPLMREHLLAVAAHRPTWGAPYLRAVLRLQHPDVDWPSVRTMQRWLKGQRGEPVRERRESTEYNRAAYPHQRWQMDASDQMPLLTGEQVSWLRLADECSGAFLKTRVFPPRAFQSGGAAVSSRGVARQLRAVGPARAVSGGQWQSMGQRE